MSNLKNTPVEEFVLDEFTRGFAQCVDNNWNYAIYAQNPDVSIYQNEYNAGYVQGKVQTGKVITAARDTTWRASMLDPTGGTPGCTNKVPDEMVEISGSALIANYNYQFDYVKTRQDDPMVASLIRLMYRMLGIYEGAADKQPRKDVKLDDLDLRQMDPRERTLNYKGESLSFLDVYYINAQCDLMDAVHGPLTKIFAEVCGDNQNVYRLPIGMGVPIGTLEKSDEAIAFQPGTGNYDWLPKPDVNQHRCSGFVHRVDADNVYWSHTAWCCVYDMSCAVTYVIGDDFITQNAFCPGQFGSNMDFGFNGKGIGFNETTETYLYNESKVLGLWIVWRSAAAEHFAGSIDEFYKYLMMDNTGTYLNAYNLVNCFTGEIGLVDMSYARMVLFKGDGEKLTCVDSTGYVPNPDLDWDRHMISPSHVLSCNIPIYRKIWHESRCMDGAPMRRYQLYRHINNVDNMDRCKHLVTYNTDTEPISIAGRLDLGFGTTEFPGYHPHGSVDAKAFGTAEMREVLANLSKKPSKDGQKTSFWMKYGSPYIAGQPFTWSMSRWAKYKPAESEDGIPDKLDGRWNRVKMFME